MRECKECGATDEVAEFYAGIGNYCKPCWRARVKRNRENNVEYYRAYDRDRADRPDRVLAREQYRGTPRGKERDAAGSAAWIKRNPQKRAAHIATNNAIRDGRLIRGPCEVCGDTKVTAHHDDYNKPLIVRWLCRKCHAAHHKAEREVERSIAVSAP